MGISQFHAPTVISKKRDGIRLSDEEITKFVEGFTSGRVSEAQMSAMAMAILLRGMDEGETACLTKTMVESGDRIEWGEPDDHPPVVDKHSTGGIGDKVSLILAPLLACDGCWVPMISGRGLGITGGTLDKLESIPGYRTDLRPDEFQKVVTDVGCAISGQTSEICPADKKLYALRDVTGTVPSRALIVASIMSKKLAESLNALVLDVKFGSGAFMKSREDAVELAEAMMQVGRACGVDTSYVLNPMDQPLGHAVGNALEVIEAVKALRGNCPEDLENTTVGLAEKIAPSNSNELRARLRSGQCFEKFCQMVAAQGGDVGSLENLGEIHRAPYTAEIKAERDGFIVRMDAERIGQRALLMGAGRSLPEDQIDFSVGFDGIRKVGEPVRVGDPLLKIHARTLDDLKGAAEDLHDACEISASL